MHTILWHSVKKSRTRRRTIRAIVLLWWPLGVHVIDGWRSNVEMVSSELSSALPSVQLSEVSRSSATKLLLFDGHRGDDVVTWL